jgi:hypothetical protein
MAEEKTQGRCMIDLSSIQRPDLRETNVETNEEENDLERNVMKVLENNKKEATKRISFGPLGHLFEEERPLVEEEEEQISKKEEKQLVERRKLILKLRTYLSAFPDILKSVIGQHDLEKLSLKELRGVLLDVKFTVACKNTCKVNTWGAEGLLALLEGFLEAFTPIRAQGLHTLASDPDFIDVIKEITLEHMDFVYSRPEMRALFLICNKLCTLHFTSSTTSGIKTTRNGIESVPTEEMLAIAKEMDM